MSARMTDEQSDLHRCHASVWAICDSCQIHVAQLSNIRYYSPCWLIDSAPICCEETLRSSRRSRYCGFSHFSVFCSLPVFSSCQSKDRSRCTCPALEPVSSVVMTGKTSQSRCTGCWGRLAGFWLEAEVKAVENNLGSRQGWWVKRQTRLSAVIRHSHARKEPIAIWHRFHKVFWLNRIHSS